MGWGRKWPERIPRPKVAKLSEAQKLGILKKLNDGIKLSPVLSYLGICVRPLRGRFYYEWGFDEPSKVEIIGRVTPLTTLKDDLLLEVKTNSGNWSQISQGTTRKIIDTIANDTKGTFHGLGALNKSLRTAKKEGIYRLEIEQHESLQFVYNKSGKKCSVQEVLYHYCDVPIDIIAKPRRWYIYHREPQIAEINDERTKILVRFMSLSYSGNDFGGTCLYMLLKNTWHCFTIKPNQSINIKSSIGWLEKRGWDDWG